MCSKPDLIETKTRMLLNQLHAIAKLNFKNLDLFYFYEDDIESKHELIEQMLADVVVSIGGVKKEAEQVLMNIFQVHASVDEDDENDEDDEEIDDYGEDDDD